jgi:ubiquinone biosynthesis protein
MKTPASKTTQLLPDLHLNRFREIAEVLVHHGLGWIANASGLERFIPFHTQSAPETLTSPQRLRLALEELGATFIKLGQFLSTRPDLTPPDYQEELSKLQDSVAPISSELAQASIEAALGRSIDQVFASFDPTPVASASIGQAHAATLPDGEEVIIKVRRPGVVAQVEEDLEILRSLAVAIDRRWEFAKRIDVIGLAEEFAATLRLELNYLQEGRNAERFAENFADDSRVHIPKVYWETTTARILTLERIKGTKVSDLSSLESNGFDRRELAVQGAQIILRMIFEHGYFHADLHPGNFFIEAEGCFGLIDFGMVGTLDTNAQEHLAGLVLAIMEKDYDRLVDVLLALGATRERVDRRALRRDLELLISISYGQPLGEIDLTALINEALSIMRRHSLHLPPDLALLVKTIIMTEGLGAQLDPNFHLITVLEPYAGRLLLHQRSPFRLLRKLDRMTGDLVWLGVEIPQQLRRLIGEFERRGFEVGMKPQSFDPLIDRLERLVNRIVLGMLTSAFIIGLAILLSVYRPAGLESWIGVMVAIGFFFAIVLGIYLAWSILKPKQK